MSTKHHVDRMAVDALIEQLDSAERKLRMIKQYVDPTAGTVKDMNIVAGLLVGATDCTNNVRDLLVKFI